MAPQKKPQTETASASDTMRVQLICGRATNNGAIPPGRIIDVSSEEGERMIAKGHATRADN